MIETIDRKTAMEMVQRWHTSPRLKGDKEAVSARVVPRGRYLFLERDGSVGALDNSDGHCRVANFESLREAARWMRGEVDEEQ